LYTLANARIRDKVPVRGLVSEFKKEGERSPDKARKRRLLKFIACFRYSGSL
jgi:hypothetical protein